MHHVDSFRISLTPCAGGGMRDTGHSLLLPMAKWLVYDGRRLVPDDTGLLQEQKRV